MKRRWTGGAGATLDATCAQKPRAFSRAHFRLIFSRIIRHCGAGARARGRHRRLATGDSYRRGVSSAFRSTVIKNRPASAERRTAKNKMAKFFVLLISGRERAPPSTAAYAGRHFHGRAQRTLAKSAEADRGARKAKGGNGCRPRRKVYTYLGRNNTIHRYA